MSPLHLKVQLVTGRRVFDGRFVIVDEYVFSVHGLSGDFVPRFVLRVIGDETERFAQPFHRHRAAPHARRDGNNPGLVERHRFHVVGVVPQLDFYLGVEAVPRFHHIRSGEPEEFGNLPVADRFVVAEGARFRHDVETELLTGAGHVFLPFENAPRVHHRLAEGVVILPQFLDAVLVLAGGRSVFVERLHVRPHVVVGLFRISEAESAEGAFLRFVLDAHPLFIFLVKPFLFPLGVEPRVDPSDGRPHVEEHRVQPPYHLFEVDRTVKDAGRRAND